MSKLVVLGWGWPAGDRRNVSHLIIEEQRGDYKLGVALCGYGRSSGQVQRTPIEGYKQCAICKRMAEKEGVQ